MKASKILKLARKLALQIEELGAPIHSVDVTSLEYLTVIRITPVDYDDGPAISNLLGAPLKRRHAYEGDREIVIHGRLLDGVEVDVQWVETVAREVAA